MYLCVHVCACVLCVCAVTCMWRPFYGLSSLFPPFPGLWGSHPGRWTCMARALPAAHLRDSTYTRTPKAGIQHSQS